MNFIAFPALGIKWMIDPVAFSFGPFSVRWYGIMLSLAIFSTLLFAMRQAPRHGITSDAMVDMFMFALPVSVIFARLFFVLVEWNAFRDDLLGMFRIWEGGITIYGAVFGAVVTVYVFCRVRKYKMWEWVDFACVYLPLAQAIGRFGNFFNQELYGGNTTLPWGMTGSLIQAFPNPGVDGNLPVHPTFLYESLWNLLVFAILMGFRPRSKKRGQVFAAYLFLYSLGRFGMEFIRTDVFSVGNTDLRANMLMAAGIAIIGIILFLVRGRTPDSAWVPLAATNAAPVAVEETKSEVETEEEETGRSAYGGVLRSLREKEAEQVVVDGTVLTDRPNGKVPEAASASDGQRDDAGTSSPETPDADTDDADGRDGA